MAENIKSYKQQNPVETDFVMIEYDSLSLSELKKREIPFIGLSTVDKNFWLIGKEQVEKKLSDLSNSLKIIAERKKMVAIHILKSDIKLRETIFGLEGINVTGMAEKLLDSYYQQHADRETWFLEKEKVLSCLYWKNKTCRRCLKSVEEIKKCGEVNCPLYIPGGNFGGMIKRDLKIELTLEYFIDNLCNNCADKFEDVLTAFYNYWTIGRSQEEFGNKNIEVSAEGGYKGKYFFDTKSKTIKIWEEDKSYEFDLKKVNLENILNTMNF